MAAQVLERARRLGATQQELGQHGQGRPGDGEPLLGAVTVLRHAAATLDAGDPLLLVQRHQRAAKGVAPLAARILGDCLCALGRVVGDVV